MRLLMTIFALCLSYTVLAQDGPAYGDNPDAGGYASVNGIDMYYEIYGGGEPFLMIHGNGQSLAAMQPQIEGFSDRYRVIAADSRGHGKTPLNTERLTYMQMMEDLNALLDSLNVRSANVYGWSDGGIIGLLLAIHHPDKVAKLAVMGANLRPDETAVHNWARDILAGLKQGMDEAVAAGDNSEEMNLASQHLGLLMTQPDIPVEQVRTITAPVLVINGDKDILRNEHQLEIFDNLQNAHLAILPGETHWAPVSDPEGFNALLGRFFDRPFTRPDSHQKLLEYLGAH